MNDVLNAFFSVFPTDYFLILLSLGILAIMANTLYSFFD